MITWSGNWRHGLNCPWFIKLPFSSFVYILIILLLAISFSLSRACLFNEVNTKCDVYSFQVVTSEIIMRKNTGGSSLIFNITVVIVIICITSPPNANWGCFGPMHFPSSTHQAREKCPLLWRSHFDARIPVLNLVQQWNKFPTCTELQPTKNVLLSPTSFCVSRLLILLHCLPCCRFVFRNRSHGPSVLLLML